MGFTYSKFIEHRTKIATENLKKIFDSEFFSFYDVYCLHNENESYQISQYTSFAAQVKLAYGSGTLTMGKLPILGKSTFIS